MDSQWYLEDKDIPTSIPAREFVESLPTIFVTGSGRNNLINCIGRVTKYAIFVPLSSPEIVRISAHIKPFGAVIMQLNSGDNHPTEDNIAASILTSLSIPFVVCGDDHIPCGKVSTILHTAPYFDIGKRGENIDIIVDYLLTNYTIGNSQRITRRRGISRAKL